MHQIFCLFLIFFFFSYPATVTIQLSSGSASNCKALEKDSNLFLPAIHIADLLSISHAASPEKHKTLFHASSLDLIIVENNPFIKLGDSVLQLQVSPIREGNDVFIHAEELISCFDQLIPEKLILAREKKVIQVIKAISAVKTENPPSPLKPIQVPSAPISNQTIDKATLEERKNGVLYTLFLPDSMTFDYTFFKPQLNLNIFKGKVSAENINQNRAEGLLLEVEATQFADNAQISLILSAKIQNPEVRYRSNPPRIEVSLRLDAPSESKTSTTTDTVKKPNSSTIEKVSKIKTVIIDPGHGGKDPGAVSSKLELREKTAVLRIGNKLALLLKAAAPEIRCVMTRDDDTFIPLKDRVRIANKEKGSLFISIHANSIKGGQDKRSNINGYSVYFLDVARDDEARAVAALENSALEYEEESKEEALTGLDFILKSTELNVYRNESEAFAIVLEQEMGRVLKEVKRNKTGVSQAGFYVLRGPEMPAVLIETAFISNPKEAELLGNDDFQQQMAQAICNSVLQFKEKYEKLSHE